MERHTPSTISLVLVPAGISLVVTLVRLIGELQGGSDVLFGSSGIVGIAWLIPIFGVWFGLRLRLATGRPVRLGQSAILFVIAIAVFFGGMFAITASGLFVMPEEDGIPAEPSGLGWFYLVLALALVVAFAAWPRLALVLLVYGFLARAPVVAVIWIAVSNGWDVHYAELPSGFPPADGMDRVVTLAAPQLTFWPGATILAGGLAGCLGGVLAGRR